MTHKMDITKEELNKYYLIEKHTHAECLKHFSITSFQFYKLLHQYNLFKPTAKEFMSRISKKEFTEYYVIQNHSKEETLEHYNITPDILAAVVKKYQINKNITKLSNNKLKFKTLTKQINKELLTDLYINQKNTLEQIGEQFKIKQSKLIKLLAHYKIYKFQPHKYPRLKNDTIPNNFDENTFYNYYLTQNHSIKETADYFKCNISFINRYLKSNQHIKKSKEQLQELAYKTKLNKRNHIVSDKIFTNFSTEFQKIYNDRDASIIFLTNREIKTNTPKNLSIIFNCCPTTVCNWVKKLDLKDYVAYNYPKSHYEDEIKNFILENVPQIKIIENSKQIIPPLELDFYLPEYKIGIEFNGTYWHSDKQKPKNYHLNKSMVAEKAGLRLIHIYEYEWNDLSKQSIIKSLLKIALQKVESKIYARKCQIKEITNKEAKDFNNQNHLQGHRNAQVTYGLFYNNKLVQLMSFSKTKYNKNLKGNDSWEIIRGCPGSNNIVIGGVSKLFKHFIEEKNPAQVFSYCDFNKFNGSGYEAIGMSFAGYTGPDMKWIMHNNEVINRNPKKHNKLKKEAFACIYGAGSKKYLFLNNK